MTAGFSGGGGRRGWCDSWCAQVGGGRGVEGEKWLGKRCVKGRNKDGTRGVTAGWVGQVSAVLK